MLLFSNHPVSGHIMDQVGATRSQGPVYTEITYTSLSNVYFSSWPFPDPYPASSWRPVFIAKFAGIFEILDTARLGVIFRHTADHAIADIGTVKTLDGEVRAVTSGAPPRVVHEWDCRGAASITGSTYMVEAPFKETPTNFEIELHFPTGGLEYVLFAYPICSIIPQPVLSNPTFGKQRRLVRTIVGKRISVTDSPDRLFNFELRMNREWREDVIAGLELVDEVNNVYVFPSGMSRTFENSPIIWRRPGFYRRMAVERHYGTKGRDGLDVGPMWDTRVKFVETVVDPRVPTRVI